MTSTNTLPTPPERSYRSVPMCPPDAMMGAAAYLEREYGPGRRIGLAGTWQDSWDRTWFVFQCAASDGSRFLIRAMRNGDAGYFDASLEAEIGAMLDVEVSPR